MRQVKEAVGSDLKHEIEMLCSNCGYDLDEAELTADSCLSCGESLNLRQNTKIYATGVPPASGTTLVITERN